MSARVVEVTNAVRDDIPAVTPREERQDMPLPTEPRTIFLGGLFLLASLAALYVASPILLPVVLAIVLKLLLQPLVRLTDRIGLPRALGALFAILLLVAALAGVVSGVAGPAASWAGKLPDAIPQIQQQLAFLARPIGTLEWMMGQLQSVVGGGVSVPQASSEHPSFNIMGVLFSGTATVAAGLFTTLVVLFYLLVSARRSCVVWSRSCRALPRSVRRWRSRWISNATSRSIWSP